MKMNRKSSALMPTNVYPLPWQQQGHREDQDEEGSTKMAAILGYAMKMTTKWSPRQPNHNDDNSHTMTTMLVYRYHDNSHAMMILLAYNYHDDSHATMTALVYSYHDDSNTTTTMLVYSYHDNSHAMITVTMTTVTLSHVTNAITTWQNHTTMTTIAVDCVRYDNDQITVTKRQQLQSEHNNTTTRQQLWQQSDDWS